jgi:hypothetical protein
VFWHFFVPLSVGSELTRYARLRAHAPDREPGEIAAALVLDHALGVLALLGLAGALLLSLRPFGQVSRWLPLAVWAGLAMALLLMHFIRRRLPTPVTRTLRQMNARRGAVARALGRQAVDDLRRLQEVERELERQGYLTRKGGDVELTAKAIRRIGQTALRRVFASLESGARGDHDVRDAGSAGELTGTTREWRFGDEQPLDVVKTVSNAVRRRMVDRDGPLLRPEDFEIRETETRTRAAVAQSVDQSWSMVMNDTWRAAKTTALALHTLATTAYPLDAVQVISFDNLARPVAPH